MRNGYYLFCGSRSNGVEFDLVRAKFDVDRIERRPRKCEDSSPIGAGLLVQERRVEPPWLYRDVPVLQDHETDQEVVPLHPDLW
jgi:hypothetical protein